MRKKLQIAGIALLLLAVLNLSWIAVVQWRRAGERERYIAQLEAQLAEAQPARSAAPAPTRLLSPMEEIHRAVNSGDVPQLRALLDAHPDLINATTHNRFGSTPLQFAAFNNQPASAAELLRRGANVNVVNKDGRTPLHDAISAGSQAIVRLLLDHGADVHLQTSAKTDPAAFAVEKKRTAIVEMIRLHEQTARPP